MTVSAQVPTNSYTANGVTTVFPYTFKIVDADDLLILVDGVEVISGFTVSGVGVGSGGSVTFSVAPTASSAIVVQRDMEITRETDYQEGGDLLAETLDADIDRAFLVMQQIQEGADRSLTLPEGSSSSGEIPEIEANQYLVGNSTGNGLTFTTAIPGEPDPDVMPDAPLTGSERVAIKQEGAWFRTKFDSLADWCLRTYAGFTSAGSGAVSRTVQSKLRDVISVKDFGAVGDGATNDTAAIQAAINYAQNLSVSTDHGVRIIFPAGSYLHGNVTITTSGITLDGCGNARLLKTTTTGNGFEFKAPNYPADPNARIFNCGMVGFTVGNAIANGTSGANVFFHNVGDASFLNNKASQFPFKPFNAFRFERCIGTTFFNCRISDCADTGVIFKESGGIFGGASSSNVNGRHGWEFDTCTANYLKTIQGYGNASNGALIHSTITVSAISDQSSFYLIESWDMDTSGSHNWSISDLHESKLVNCWGSTQNVTTPGLNGFTFFGGCTDIDIVSGEALTNTNCGALVDPSCKNINFLGGTYNHNGTQAGSSQRAGISHQGTGIISKITAKNQRTARYGSTQQYGVQVIPATASSFMRLRDCDLAGNAVSGIIPITATAWTNFDESGNDSGLSSDVASATGVVLPSLGSNFNITGTTDIYGFSPVWKGRKISLTFASTSRIIAGTGIRLPTAAIQPGQYGTAELLYDGGRWVLTSWSANDNV